MIRTLIIDDEQHCINRLSGLLDTHCKHHIEVMATCSSVSEGIEAINKFKPDLIFLDVQIHDETGFDLLQKLNDIRFEVIFTTAYEQYAVQAFKFSAIDYLLKPVDADDLQQAVNKLKDKMHKETLSQQFETLFHNLRNIHGISKRISIPTINGLIFVQVTDIIRCESDVNYTTIFFKDKQKIIVAKTLKEFEELLKECNFYRVHNSHLINLAYIKSYNKGKGGFVSLTDGYEIEVSSRRKEGFLKKISEM